MFDKLPTESILLILSFLSPPDRTKVRGVSKDMQIIADDLAYWKLPNIWPGFFTAQRLKILAAHDLNRFALTELHQILEQRFSEINPADIKINVFDFKSFLKIISAIPESQKELLVTLLTVQELKIGSRFRSTLEIFKVKDKFLSLFTLGELFRLSDELFRFKSDLLKYVFAKMVYLVALKEINLLLVNKENIYPIEKLKTLREIFEKSSYLDTSIIPRCVEKTGLTTEEINSITQRSDMYNIAEAESLHVEGSEEVPSTQFNP